MTEIKAVYPKEDYHLEILLSNGNNVTLNLKPKLKTIRFGLLHDDEFFRLVETDGKVIRWQNKVTLSSSEVFEMIRT